MTGYLPPYVTADQIIGGLLTVLGLMALWLLLAYARLRTQRRELRHARKWGKALELIGLSLENIDARLGRQEEGVVCPANHCKRAMDSDSDSSRTIQFAKVQNWGPK